MQVGIKDGGDGVRCWNVSSVHAYADEVNRREQQVAQSNPDVAVLPGRLVCYGCEVMEYDYGVKCTATLTRTRYAVQGEIEPRLEDAKGSLLDIAGFQGRAPADIETAAKAETAAVAAAPAPAAASDGRRSGLRGLFNR
ncbi:hypothetical protein [uncultured Friedmanniella sp.]|uniref:hypothetical protein n=1 Tax=uncultured Friedmanniella sp. TaxID=335381 RepID=UPI0035CB52EE